MFTALRYSAIYGALVCATACFAGFDSQGGGHIGQSCSEDSECRSGFCDGGVCAEVCVESTCGGACIDRRCERCERDEQCTADRVCERGSCVRACDESRCSGFCDRLFCLLCLNDDECGPARRCIEGDCIRRCIDNSDCMSGVCHRGVCGEVCEQPSDCLAVSFSNTERVPRRRSYFGCSASLRAVVDPVCGEDLPNSRPEGTPIGCDPCLASRGGCAPGQTCENGDCTCDDNSDCAGLACVDGYCAPCTSDGECGCGAYCSLGECLPACNTERDCDSGFNCVNRRCATCSTDSDCQEGALCYEDGCVSPCSEEQPCGGDTEGRSSICEIFGLRSDLSPVCE